MKRLLLPILTSLLVGGLANVAMAQVPANPAPAEPAIAADATAVGTQSSDRVDDRNCLRDTGSRITAAANARERRAGKKQTNCAGSPGRSYSQDDIQRTGETNTADALRRLDPSIH